MKSDLNKERLYLLYLKSVKGLKESLISDYLKTGILPSQLYHSPPNLIYPLIKNAQQDQALCNKVKSEFTLYKTALSILDDDYPELLKNIFDPPLFLFYQGNLKLLTNDYLLTIVGSRTLSIYHQQALEQIFTVFKNTPLVIVSGLAYGVDALAHTLALKNNLSTIGVLGSGFHPQAFYPATNKQLARDIIKQGGLILSEYPPLTKASVYQFPQRNRILAALSKVTMVISGNLQSGTLITAQSALDNNREVYALPGNINNPLCQGANELIYQGANILLSGQDILKIYNL